MADTLKVFKTAYRDSATFGEYYRLNSDGNAHFIAKPRNDKKGYDVYGPLHKKPIERTGGFTKEAWTRSRIGQVRNLREFREFI